MKETSDVACLLAKTLIFNKIEASELKSIFDKGGVKLYEVGDLIFDPDENSEPIPLIVILEGCVAVIESNENDTKEDIFDALVMPLQVLGEFQILGDSFPDHIKLKAFEKTKTFEINKRFLNDLSDKYKIQFYKNLAKTLVEKIYLGNLQLSIRNSGRASNKFPEYLKQVLLNEVWSRITEKRGEKYNLNIFWTVERLSQYLSLDEPTSVGILKKFVKEKVGEIVWYDNEFKPIENLTENDIEHLTERGSQLKRKTKFKIINLVERKIRKLEKEDRNKKDY